MTNYTPTTEEVRNDYVTFYNSGACCDEHAAEVYDAAYDFDRWLAKHDAEVAKAERQRIIELLQREASEWISKGKEDLRLVALIKGENE